MKALSVSEAEADYSWVAPARGASAPEEAPDRTGGMGPPARRREAVRRLPPSLDDATYPCSEVDWRESDSMPVRCLLAAVLPRSYWPVLSWEPREPRRPHDMSRCCSECAGRGYWHRAGISFCNWDRGLRFSQVDPAVDMKSRPPAFYFVERGMKTSFRTCFEPPKRGLLRPNACMQAVERRGCASAAPEFSATLPRALAGWHPGRPLEPIQRCARALVSIPTRRLPRH